MQGWMVAREEHLLLAVRVYTMSGIRCDEAKMVAFAGQLS